MWVLKLIAIPFVVVGYLLYYIGWGLWCLIRGTPAASRAVWCEVTHSHAHQQTSGGPMDEKTYRCGRCGREWRTAPPEYM